MNSVQVYHPSTSATKLLSSDKLVHDLASIVDDDLWSDIEVKVQDKSFRCHKNILTARSSYFKQRLRSDRHLTEIVEEDGNADAFDLVRRYIYTGTVAIGQADEEVIANAWSLSIKYKLEELTNFASDRIRERITAANAVTMFRLMADMKRNSIADECLQFIRVHGENCFHSESYIELNLSQFVRLLKNVSLGDKDRLTLIRMWSKRHRGVDAAELFDMLDGEGDRGHDRQIDGTGERQYILLKGEGKMVILDAATFDHVSTRNEPTTKDCQIAVCNGLLYAVDTMNGEIKSTPVSRLLTSESIQWDTCAEFQSSNGTYGNVAVVDAIIYFFDQRNLWKFDTTSKAVTKSCELEGGNVFTFLLELNSLVYCYKDNRFQFTDGINEWTTIALPSSLGQYPSRCSLIKMRDTICLVGGSTPGYLSRVLCYDTRSSSWTQGNRMKQARRWAGAVSLDGGRALVVGGCNGEWMDTIEQFNEKTNQWTLIDYKVKLVWPQAITFYSI